VIETVLKYFCLLFSTVIIRCTDFVITLFIFCTLKSFYVFDAGVLLILGNNCFTLEMDSSIYNSLKWVHTCTVTAYRNAVTLQVTDTIHSYDLNFHPMPHDVTVSYKRYTVGFRVCYGSQNHHECKDGERNGRWWSVMLHVQTCSGCNRIIPTHDGQILTAHQTCPLRYRVTDSWYVTCSRVPSTLLWYGVMVCGNVTVCTHHYGTW
jgi:hypothetical protein